MKELPLLKQKNRIKSSVSRENQVSKAYLYSSMVVLETNLLILQLAMSEIEDASAVSPDRDVTNDAMLSRKVDNLKNSK